MNHKYFPLSDILKNSAIKQPQKTAVFFEDQKFTFQQLNNLSSQFAGLLYQEGVRTGDRVGILLSNRPEYIAAYFAIFQLGALAVPINQLLAPTEITHILKDCSPKLVITETNFKSMITEEQSRLLIEEMIKNNTVNKEKLYSTQEIDPNSTAVIIYTSGTTGHPKGVMLSHKNLSSNISSSLQACQIKSKDRFLLFLPLFHSFTITVCILIPCYLGATIILIPSLARDKIKKGIVKHKATIFVGIPTIFSLMASRKLKWWQRLLNPVRLYFCGGAPLAKEIRLAFEQQYRRPLVEGYGLSETSPVVSINPPKGKRPIGSVGPPIPGVEIKIISETGAELGPGEVGEILIRGDNVTSGYYNLPEITASTIREGWLYTGDLGQKDEQGYLYIADRKKDMLIVHGCNVYPREIEEVLLQHKSVSEVAVIGISDNSRGEVPKAFVVLNEGCDIGGVELKRFCKDKLAGYKIPHFIEITPELPKTATGKVLKRELRLKNHS